MREVIIVGGGPIGSIVGILLAKEGVDVLILEKQKHPRWKPCGEGLSKEGIDILRSNDVYKPVQHLFHDITSLSFNILSSNMVHHKSDTPIAYTFDRMKFDHALIEHAQDVGADVHELERVKKITENKKIQVTTQNDMYHSNLAIGADGVNSVVGKQLYRTWTNNEVGIAKVARYKLQNQSNTVDASTMEYYFIKDGIGWIFPRNEDAHIVLNIGCVTNTNNRINDVFNTFISMIKSLKQIQLSSSNTETKTWLHLIPGNGPCRTTYTKATLLVGDAGGFVNPLTGGGLKYGTLSATYAVDTVMKLLNSEIHSLKPYEEKWQHDIGPIFTQSSSLRDKVFFKGASHLLNVVKRNPALKEELLWSFINKPSN